MESLNRINNSSSTSRVIPVIIVLVGLIALYYLYQYLFGPSTSNTYELITSTQTAQTDTAKPITFSTTDLAPLYEGGEFSISTWIYINNWSYRAGYNKPILRIGGSNFDSIRLYLGANNPKLFVRLHTKEQGAVLTADNDSSSNAAAASANRGPVTTGGSPDSLEKATYKMTFNLPQVESGLLDNSHMCDIPELPLQRWVNISVSVNGKTVDVYIDGKLSRSCVLHNPFKVDSSGYTGFALENGGFGGKISTTTMYDTALNPETVYKNYMAGPEPITSFTGLLGSFFAHNISISFKAKDSL